MAKYVVLKARLAKLTSNGNWIMVPLDHGVSDGPLPGIENPVNAFRSVMDYASCTTVHRGLVGRFQDIEDRPGLLMHLSAGTSNGPDPLDKRLVGTPADAARAECDGVSIHINVGSPHEARQLEDAGKVASGCAQYDLPLIIMAYPRGPGINERDPVRVAHAARLADELGADAVKVPFTGSEETFAPVVEGCQIPVLVAGGPTRSLDELILDVQAAKNAGAKGISIGRNVFQNPEPARAMQRLASVFN